MIGLRNVRMFKRTCNRLYSRTLSSLYYELLMVCTAWALSMYWVDVSHETTPCLVCCIPDITDQSTLQLKPFNLRLNLQYKGAFTQTLYYNNSSM